MDWIEEKKNALVNKIRNANLRRSLYATMLLCLLLAVVLYIVTRNLCLGWILVLRERYVILNEMNNFWYVMNLPNTAFVVRAIFVGLNVLYEYGILVYGVFTEYVGIRLYFKKKVEPGFEAANAGIEYMKLGDYGHEQNYFARDEAGNLCDHVEELRRQLVQQKHQEWEQQSEQREINAAFAHDLRTPLTVMKGYTEFLLKYEPTGKVSQESLLEKLEIMYQQQERLLEFSKTMTQIQNIEMREVQCQNQKISEIREKMEQLVTVLERESGIRISLRGVEHGAAEATYSVVIDLQLMMEVCENLLMNALRYAREEVVLTIVIEERKLFIYVRDDGDGFSRAALKQAKNLYWSEDKKESSHFGMGLYLCEKLCEKHGGRLSLTNGIEGGAIAAAEFQIVTSL